MAIHTRHSKSCPSIHKAQCKIWDRFSILCLFQSLGLSTGRNAPQEITPDVSSDVPLLRSFSPMFAIATHLVFTVCLAASLNYLNVMGLQYGLESWAFLEDFWYFQLLARADIWQKQHFLWYFNISIPGQNQGPTEWLPLTSRDFGSGPGEQQNEDNQRDSDSFDHHKKFGWTLRQKPESVFPPTWMVHLAHGAIHTAMRRHSHKGNEGKGVLLKLQ